MRARTEGTHCARDRGHARILPRSQNMEPKRRLLQGPRAGATSDDCRRVWQVGAQGQAKGQAESSLGNGKWGRGARIEDGRVIPCPAHEGRKRERPTRRKEREKGGW
ncbi:hypothetical protein SLA2020_435380 [Shorea laevis]